MARVKFTDVDSCEIDTVDLGCTKICDIVKIHKNVDGFRLKDGRYFDKTGFINVDFYNNEVEIQRENDDIVKENER